jgi:hypothetical protein
LNKAVAYSLLAAILGIVLTLLPLITLVEIWAPIRPNPLGGEDTFLPFLQLKELDGVSEGTPADSNLDLTVLAIAFAIAAAIYLLNKRRLSSRDQEYARFNPY